MTLGSRHRVPRWEASSGLVMNREIVIVELGAGGASNSCRCRGRIEINQQGGGRTGFPHILLDALEATTPSKIRKVFPIFEFLNRSGQYVELSPCNQRLRGMSLHIRAVEDQVLQRGPAGLR